MFLITPKGEGQYICEELEDKYFDIALTVKNAFEFYSTNINDFLYEFSDVSNKVTIKLEDRKKSKIYQINPDSNLSSITIGEEVFSFENNTLSESGEVCKLCSVRDSKYITYNYDEKISVCPSCYRKNKVGKEKLRFYNEYKFYTGKEIKEEIKSIIELKDDNKNIAVIYGDGNNMGNIVKNIDSPFKMAYFSRNTDRITRASVYNTIGDSMKDKAIFEVIALGGDDIFVIVPANYSLDIAQRIVENFDKSFNYEITMSVGICVAKYNTPIKNIFSIAQKKLKSAKQFVKEKKLREGSIDLGLITGDVSI